MAGTKISDLPSASTLTGAELVPVVQSDVTKKTTVSDILTSAGAGTVTSVNVSGGTTGLTATGGPITTSGTITLSGTLDVDNGGTGATTAANARTNLDVPSRSGSGASGTWSIDVTGNAGTVTNGVYTTGSYSNPSWITALAGSKVTGNISGNAANVTGTVAVANGGTGATTASGARTNLSAAASGANSDITSLSGVTGGISTADYVDFDTVNTPASAVGRVFWDGGTTLNVGMTSNVTGKVNESLYVYVKASAAITKGQVIVQDGAVGGSGVLKAKPAPTGLTDAQTILGVAAEDIALNAFGLIQTHGYLTGLNTTGSSVGETWADGDQLYYNPAYVGGLTKVKPTAPYIKLPMGEVVNAGSGGSGSLIILIGASSQLGGTDSNVQFSTLANGQTLIYNASTARWENNTLTAGSGISITNGAGSVSIAATNSGTVTSVNVSGGSTGLTTSGGPITSSGTISLGGILAVGYGGTGATTAPNARINLLPSYTSNAGKVLAVNVGGTDVEWIAAGGTGTVTSVAVSGGSTGLTTSGGPITGAGTITLAGTLGVGYGGTGQTSYTDGQLLIGNSTGNTLTKSTLTAGSGISITNGSGSITIAATGGGGSGTVTSVDVSGGTTGLSFSGGPVTSSGTITMAGTLGIANGGTGQVTQQAAINALAGAQTSGYYLRGNGTNVSMSAIQAGDVPTLNQNTTGSAGSVANALTINNSGTGDASGSTYNGSAAKTISYNSIGASPLAGSSSLTTVGTIGSGTWQGSTIAVGYGGTGATTLTGYVKGNGTSAFTASSTVPGSDVSGNISGNAANVTGTVAVANGGTGLTSGTSGGVLYYSAAGTLASSSALAANALVVGGGAGVAPSTVTTGTGVVTALGVNTGSAGAFVVNGGALGTPSSGTLTNATGLPISTGVSGLGANVATFLATPSSANLASAVTDETGSGSLVFATSPTLVTPVLGTPTSGNLSNCTADGTNAVGFKNIPQSGSAKTTSYTLATTDVGKFIQVGTSGSIVIPNSTFAAGDVVSVFNNTSGSVTVTCSTTNCYIAGTDTNKTSVTLATRGVVTILFVTSTLSVLTGNVS